MSVERRLRQILTIPDQTKREVTLREFAQDLGCSLDSTYEVLAGNLPPKHLEHVVIQRIREAARGQREERLWLVALISAVSSALSALAAWCAVLLKKVP